MLKTNRESRAEDLCMVDGDNLKRCYSKPIVYLVLIIGLHLK